MRRGMRRHVCLLLAVALAAAAGGCASTRLSSPAELDARIRAARTKADHEALAAQYAERARELAAQAREHDAVARSYVGLSLGAGDGIWMRHCATLAQKLQAAALGK